MLDSEQAFDKMRSMSRTRVRRRRLVLTVSVALVAGAWSGPIASAVGGHGSEPTAVARTTYVVRGGDTLWSIAEGMAPGRDPRLIVDAISSINGVDAGSLVPGQTLVIPAA
ncbi:MAG: LysM peptidoglycan-binding domain-containing protein [Actinomycetota bacterium]